MAQISANGANFASIFGFYEVELIGQKTYSVDFVYLDVQLIPLEFVSTFHVPRHASIIKRITTAGHRARATESGTRSQGKASRQELHMRLKVDLLQHAPVGNWRKRAETY